MEALAVTMGLKTVIMYKRCISVCPIISSYFLVNHITGNLGSVYTVLAHIIPSKWDGMINTSGRRNAFIYTKRILSRIKWSRWRGLRHYFQTDFTHHACTCRPRAAHHVQQRPTFVIDRRSLLGVAGEVRWKSNLPLKISKSFQKLTALSIEIII